MLALAVAALALAPAGAQFMARDEYGEPKFGSATFDPSEFPVSESLTVAGCVRVCG
jgi:hypothetical protein